MPDENFKVEDLITFRQWFNPHNHQHILWAMEYLFTNPIFDWNKVVPKYVVVNNSYGVRETILTKFAKAWIQISTGEKVMEH